MKSKEQLKFEEERKNLSDRDVQMEILYLNTKRLQTLERIRGNTSTISTIFVICIVLGVVIGAIASLQAIYG